MANANRPMGMVPHSYLSGAMWNGQFTMYCIPSTEASAIAIGDPVTLAGSADAKGVPTITIATGGFGNLVLGCVVSYGGIVYGGSMIDPSNLETTVIPATKTKAYYVGVCDDPNVIYAMQEDSIGNNLAATDMGNNIDLITGTNNGYVSGWMIDSSTANTGATRQLKLLRALNQIDNAIAQYGKYLVMINHHQYRPGVAGV